MIIKTEELDIFDVDQSELFPEIPFLTNIKKTEDTKYEPDIVLQPRHFCELCSSGFTSADILHTHMFSHSEDRKFECTICGNKYKTKYILNQHVKNKHVKPCDRKHICKLCSKGFTTSSILTRHMFTHKEREFECATCRVKYKRKDMLKYHLLTKHLKPRERTHICQVCSKGFTTSSILKTHMFTHMERKFKCDFCGAKYRRKDMLKNHLITKHLKPWERNHICKVCSKGFTTASMLRRHMLTHSEERKFECTFCGGKYKSKAILNSHFKHFHTPKDV